LAPSDRSSQATCFVVAAFDMPSRRAAPVKLPSRATSTNTSMQRSRSTCPCPCSLSFAVSGIETVNLPFHRLARPTVQPTLRFPKPDPEAGQNASGFRNNSNEGRGNEMTREEDA
jgi:hypothetical protein